MRLGRFGHGEGCILLDLDDIAWVRAANDGANDVITIMLKCGQSHAVQREQAPNLFEEIENWITEQSMVNEYSDMFEMVDGDHHINPLTDVQKAYLAAFLDADGCITIARRMKEVRRKSYSYYLEVKLCQCNGPFIKMLEEEIGAGGVYSFDKGDNKKMYRLQLRDTQACEFLHVVYPYLRIKKPQADIAFRFRQTFGVFYGKNGVPENVSEERRHCYEEIKRLKGEIGRDN